MSDYCAINLLSFENCNEIHVSSIFSSVAIVRGLKKDKVALYVSTFAYYTTASLFSHMEDICLWPVVKGFCVL